MIDSHRSFLHRFLSIPKVLRHTVEVEAESLYEAAVLAIRTFRQHHCGQGKSVSWKWKSEARSFIP